MLCPRCNGSMMRDHSGDIVCIACGYEYIASIPVGNYARARDKRYKHLRWREPQMAEYTEEYEW